MGGQGVSKVRLRVKKTPENRSREIIKVRAKDNAKDGGLGSF